MVDQNNDKVIIAIETQQLLDRMKQDAIVTTLPLAKMGEIVHNIHSLFKEHLIEGVHYGVLPGTDKKMLFKPGAELIAMYFNVRPIYEISIHTFEDLNIEYREFHREYEVICKLMKYVGQNEYLEVGQGIGNCSTLESKYRFRNGEAVDTGQVPPKDYWNVYNQDKAKAKAMLPKNHIVKKNAAGSYTIHQLSGKVPNDNIADIWNTVKKMATKRAFVMAIQQFTAASNIFAEPDDPDEDKPNPSVKDEKPPEETSYVEIIPSDEDDPDFTDLLNPNYFVKRIENLKSEKEYSNFFSKYKKDISCFGGKEYDKIVEVTLIKKKELGIIDNPKVKDANG